MQPYMPTINPNPVQTQADGLTREESATAYRAVADRFGLRAPQRSKLDRSTYYSGILNAAHLSNWRAVERMLGHAGIIE